MTNIINAVMDNMRNLEPNDIHFDGYELELIRTLDDGSVVMRDTAWPETNTPAYDYKITERQLNYYKINTALMMFMCGKGMIGRVIGGKTVVRDDFPTRSFVFDDGDSILIKEVYQLVVEEVGEIINVTVVDDYTTLPRI